MAVVIANGRVEIDGVPFFPNGFFLVDRGETTTFLRDTLTMLANAGCNFVHAGMPGGSETGPFLDLAASLGLKVIEEGMSAGEMATFANHSAMLGHNIGDDVHVYDTPAIVQARHNTCKANDPGHITYFSDWGGSPEQSPFVGIGDVAGPYDYPVNTNGPIHDVDYYINQIRLIRAPIFGIPQSFNWSPEDPSLGTRPPNAAEYRNMLYQNLINKCMGLLSYDITDNVGYQRLDTKYPSLWAECVVCVGEVNTLKNMLLNGTYTKYTTNNGVLGARWAYQGGQYVILANPESTSRACTFTLTGGGTLQNVFSTRPAGFTLVGSTLSGTIAALGVHVYTTVSGTAYDLTASNLTFSPPNPVVGDLVTFSLTVGNSGVDPTPAGIVHGVVFQVDGTTVTWSNDWTTSIPGGGSRTQIANAGTAGATWPATLGTHTFRAIVDDPNLFTAETNKTNNQTSVQVDVLAAPPPATPGPVCPFVEWNFVSFEDGLIRMTHRGARNRAFHRLNSTFVRSWAPAPGTNGIVGAEHVISAECRLSGSAAGRARVFIRGFNKLNGLAEAASQTAIGVSGIGAWTTLSVSFTHIPHNNPKVPDPLTAQLVLDHNGFGMCEWRNVTVEIPPV